MYIDYIFNVFVSTFIVHQVTRQKHHLYVEYVLLKCDTCGTEFSRKNKSYKNYTQLMRQFHYCTRKCSNVALGRGGLRETGQSADGRRNAYKKSKELRIPWTSDETIRLRHESTKRNGSYGKSKPENECYEYLCCRFGKENIERQCPIKNWAIDFYIKSIDIYVQLDGVYWHGLNRPIEIIAEHKTKQDVQIHKKYLDDREQNEFFVKNGLKLIRVTDIQFKNHDLPIELI